MVAVLVLRDAGCVGGVSDVHCYRRVGVEAEGGAARAVQPDLFLHARHGDYLRREPFLLREEP